MNKEVTMYKLAALGALILALAAPANGIAKRAPQPRAELTCSQRAIFRPDRSYAICDGRFWVRLAQSQQIVPVPFWRLQQGNDPNRP